MADARWQELEAMVRTIAEAKYSAVARPEDIAGIRCDCVLRLDDGSVVVIEISKSSTLEKLRTDLAKFNILRPHFIAQNIFPRFFFVTPSIPTPSLVESGKPNFVQVFSVAQFFNALVGTREYVTTRRRSSFGSAVDLYSGKPDQNQYVRVDYFSSTGEAYSAEKVAEALGNKRTVILIGDYGAGKSRCVKEVFELMVSQGEKYFSIPLAINLRETWGLKRAAEIVTRHFTDLGLGKHAPDAIKISGAPATVYLLDGFDEIGAQTWSDDPTKLVEIRRHSLSGVRDLIERSSGGLLITGREHYFNSDAELLTALGLDKKQPLFLRCNQELSDDQFSKMLNRTPGHFPSWIPKKPLIAAIIRDIDPSLVDVTLETSAGQVDFWNLLVETICEREARINPILDSSNIRALYTRIGRIARNTQTRLGPISVKAINEAFEQTTSRPPADESAIILARLPGLSRIGAESTDRQFVDTYILDGLKAEDVLAAFDQADTDVLELEWRHPVEDFGALFMATRLLTRREVRGVVAFVKRHVGARNRVLLSDLVAALFLYDVEDVDFEELKLEKGVFSHLSLSDTRVRNLALDNCYLETLDLTDAHPQAISFSGCVVERLAGVTGAEHLPSWVAKCHIDSYQSVSTLAAIKDAGLSFAHTFLLSSLRKLFLQPGGGRKESSMYKGYGDSASKKTGERVIALLIRDGFCERIKGHPEDLFIPTRSMTGRVRAIMSQLTMSQDPLWERASKIH